MRNRLVTIFVYVKNKIQLSKFEEKIDFIQVFKSGSTPYNKQKGAPKSYRKGQVFKGRKETEKS